MTLFEKYNSDKPSENNHLLLSSLVIRSAIITDSHTLAEILNAREPGDLAQIIKNFQDEISSLDSSGRLLLVAEYNSQVIGYARAVYFMRSASSNSRNCPEGWYLNGVIIEPKYRRNGVASILIKSRLDWIVKRANKAYYFANARNRVSIEMHEKFAFKELTRDFVYPGVTFEGGEGILFEIDLTTK